MDSPNRDNPQSYAPESLRVLVVDDDRDGLAALGTLFAQFGVDVSLAASVSEARRAIEKTPPDAVVSDLVMPGEDGFALLATLRDKEQEVGHHIPTVAISALSDPDIRRRAAAEGFDAYFVKPCDFLAIFGALTRLATEGSKERSRRPSRRAP